MKNLLHKNDNNLLVPILVGAAAAAALTYFFLSDDTADLRDKLSENVNKGWDAVKENIPVSADDIAALKDKVKDTVSGVTSAGKDVANDAGNATA